MEKIDYEEAYIMVLLHSEMSDYIKKKVDEDDWLNECREAREVKEMEESDQAYDRMIEERNQVNEQQAGGGSMTQNENANI